MATLPGASFSLQKVNLATEPPHSMEILQRIAAVPVDGLSHEDTLSLECLRWDNEVALEGEPWYWHRFPITPYSAGYLPTHAQVMLGAYTFEDASQTEMYTRPVDDFADYFEQIVTHTEGQVERDIYMSKYALPGIIGLSGGMRAGVIRDATKVVKSR